MTPQLRCYNTEQITVDLGTANTKEQNEPKGKKDDKSESVARSAAKKFYFSPHFVQSNEQPLCN